MFILYIPHLGNVMDIFWKMKIRVSSRCFLETSRRTTKKGFILTTCDVVHTVEQTNNSKMTTCREAMTLLD